MIIFDWSGTLSPEAVRFGEDENLKRELELSGLAALGVATPRTFWKEIVTPTWEEWECGFLLCYLPQDD